MNTFFVAIRRAVDGSEWADLETLARSRERVDAAVARWTVEEPQHAAAQPVLRIAAVKLVEVQE